MEKTYDFSGWATRINLKCSDGRTIMKDAFKHCDGMTVPLVWNHRHDDPEYVVGNAVLEHRDEGVYTYGSFNDTPSGEHAKLCVKHGDVKSLSIFANRLKQDGGNVLHGEIREVSLVLAGANPGAYIENVLVHGEDAEDISEDETRAYIWSGENEGDLIFHAEVEKPAEAEKKEESPKTEDSTKGKTVKEIWDGITKKLDDEEMEVVYAVIGEAVDSDGTDEKEESEKEESDKGDEKTMKQNAFDKNEPQATVLSHADQEKIIAMAKQSNVGSLKQAIKMFVADNDALKHAESDGYGVFEDYGVLFPELELLKKGEPETIYKHDQGCVSAALAKIHKSPYSRIRTRMADARLAELKAKGYQKKGNEKTIMGQIAMVTRETTPQTIYIKDNLHRDDIIDITDFDVVSYQWKMMRGALNETMVLSAMVGDGREIGDPDKISEEHVRPIWKDDEEYTIHHDVDIAAAKAELQGSNTGANFGDNYIYAEAIITAALYSREKFKGTGTPDFYCTPHLVNVMLLARDLNGRRIYDSKSDLAKALNCNSIVEVEQFEGLERTDKEGNKKKLLGLFVNLNDYTFGSTRGGEITKFEDFDMDFNVQKYMLETRLSGSLYKLKSAIALEEPVTA